MRKFYFLNFCLLLAQILLGSIIHGQNAESYCESGSTSSNYEFISNVTYGTVNNDSGRENYGDFKVLSASFPQGQSFDIAVMVDGYDDDQVAVWADWNHDYIFAEEEKTTLSNATVNSHFTGAITIPADAVPGQTTMRVCCRYSAQPEPCASFTFGEVEDYSVEVIGDGLYAGFSADTNQLGIGETVVFTNASVGDNINTYTWNFGVGASPATAEGIGPHAVTYDTGGFKTVSLTISDGTDTETTTKADYIDVVTGSADFQKPAFFGATANHNVINFSWYSPNETPVFNNPEGFESGIFPPAGWAIKRSDNISGEPLDLEPGLTTWTMSSTDNYVHSGVASAAIGYEKTNSNWLVTPEIEVLGQQQLSFFLYFKNTSSYTSQFNVMIKEGNAGWVSALSMDAQSESSDMTVPVVINLSEYANKTIKIAFVQSYTDGYAIAVDDVSIESIAGFTSKAASFRKAPLKFEAKTDKKPISLVGGRERLPMVHYQKYTNVRAGEEPIAYRIYVNGDLVDEVAGDVRRYALENLSNNTYKCAVSAVYAGGESFQTGLIVVSTTDPVVDFEASTTKVGMNENITFSLLVEGSYASVNWNFGDGAVPATSTDAEATVAYSTIGKKTVSASINGNIVEEKPEYITVMPGSSDVPPLQGVEVNTDYNNVTISWPSLTTEIKWAEGFEGGVWPPTNWELKKSTALDGTLEALVDGDKGWFHCDETQFQSEGRDYIKSGDYSAAIAYDAPGFNWLISPEMQITNGDQLEFGVWYKNGEADDGIFYHTNFRVMVKADDVWTEALYYTKGASSNQYETAVTVDLSAYDAKTVQLAFVYEFTDGWQLAIDDVKVVNDASKGLNADFGKLNIYRDDVVVHEVSDKSQTQWMDMGLETDEYKYYVTYVNGEGSESFPSDEHVVRAYEIVELPYGQDFEANTSEWLFNAGDYAFKIGESTDFAKSGYAFPDHDGSFVGVNTSDVPGSISAYSEVADIIALPPMNLGQFGKVYFCMDYVSQMSGFAIIGRENPNAKWELLAQFDNSEDWITKRLELPLSALKDGYQLGLYYTNLEAVSKGVAFDNIKVTALVGKHLQVDYNNAEVTNNGAQYLGLVKPGMSADYTLKVVNVGSESIDLGSISLTGDRFAFKTNPENVTLAVQQSADIVISYTPVGETATPDAGQLIVNSNSEENPFTVDIQAECGIAKWTYMLYLYEDNTGLDGNKDLNEWEVLGSIPGEINYVVLYDCNDDAKDGIYYVTKDPAGMNSEMISPLVSTHFNEGLDMNDAQTLEDFMLWCKDNYPAEHYGCNVWDHGSGIFRKSSRTWKAACGDMKLWELADAVNAFKEVDGQGFDIFGFDVCLLGQVETVYALKDYTKVVVASEKTEPGDGWDYTTQFSILNNNPEVDVYDFARHIVVEYDKSYDDGTQGSRATTQTATRTDFFMRDFVPALDAFAEIIIPEMVDVKDQVKAARTAAWYSDGEDYEEHKDLGHFLNLLKQQEGISEEIKAKIDELLAAYELSIIESLENERPDATGLKIWIPKDISISPNAQFYLDAEQYLNISETQWDEFLTFYAKPVSFGIPVPEFTAMGELSGRQGMIVSFKDETLCQPVAISRQWTIEPKTVELLNGTTVESEEISIKFLEAGQYTISLSVTNADGEGTATKENLINTRALIFPKPQNLISSVTNRAVTLNWEAPVAQVVNTSIKRSVKLSEGFESDWLPQGWELKYSETLEGDQTDPTEPDGKKWFQCVPASFSGKGSTYIKNGTGSAAIAYSAPGFNWMITKEVPIDQYDKLKFWTWYMNGKTSDGTYYHTNFRVMVYADAAWHQALYYTDGDPANELASEIVVDLAEYSGKSIRIAFVYEFTDGWQMAIDDVKIVRDAPEGTPDGEFEKYNIYRNDQKVAETTALTFGEELENDGVYKYYVTAVYTNLDGESDPSEEVQISMVSTNLDLQALMAVKVSPNPNKGNFRLLTDNCKGAYWSLYNLSGSLVQSGFVNDDSVEITVNQSGIYLLKVECEGHSETFRVVVN